MGLFSKLFKGPQIDMEKSNENAKKCVNCSIMQYLTVRLTGLFLVIQKM